MINISKIHWTLGLALMGLAGAGSVAGQTGGADVGAAEAGMGGLSPTSSARPRRLGDSLNVDGNQEWKPDFTPESRSPSGLSLLDEQVQQAHKALARGNIMAPRQGALAMFRKVLALDPGNQKATSGIVEVSNALAVQMREAYANADQEATTQNLSDLRLVNPAHPAIDEMSRQLLFNHQSRELATAAALAMDSAQLTDAGGALDIYLELLTLDPDSEVAADGLAAIEQLLVTQATELTRQEQFAEARTVLVLATEVRGDPDETVVVQQVSVDGAERASFNARLGEVENLIDQGKFDLAENRLIQLSDRGFTGSLVSLSSDIERGRVVLTYVPGSTLTGNAQGSAIEMPKMIVVPGGSFSMGSTDAEAGRKTREGPVQQIVLAMPFAMSSTEVTVAQFRKFVDATGYLTDPEKSGRSMIFDTNAGAAVERKGVSWRKDYRGRKAKSSLPVLHISWNDAVAYARWLSEQSGEHYRLPTEAEFEYALRAGTNSAYWWGTGAPTSVVENVTGDRDRLSDLRWPVGFERYGDNHWGPAQVAEFEANPFQLFDMGGNAAEWVNDCYRQSLSGVPADGTARNVEDCQQRVVRGASWASSPELARSAYRTASGADTASCLVGFRVVKDLWLGRTSEPDFTLTSADSQLID